MHSPSLSLTFADVGWFMLSLNSATRTLYASAVDRLTNEPRGTRIVALHMSAFVTLLPRGTRKLGKMLMHLRMSVDQPYASRQCRRVDTCSSRSSVFPN